MRFIKGDSLQESADHFHQAEHPDFGSVEFRKLLGRFVDVCQAIEYAHSRGVLHRDLKPGNIMLGKYGETLVVDWGLAKTQESDNLETTVEESPLRPASASGGVPTVMGSAIGTPAFMPPEQAAGDLEKLGPTSDLYSLGATLYYLLTGRPPFSGKSVQEVLQAVQAGNFSVPHFVQANVPKAVEAICLKAMSLRPEARYDTPRALADDIERWLADEPVIACKEPLRSRARRWVKRHQTVVATAAAVVAVALLSLIVVTFLVVSHREQAERQFRVATGMRLAAQAQGIQDQLPVRSLLLALEAAEVTRRFDEPLVPAAHEILRDSLGRVGGRPLVGHQGEIWSAAFSPDGRFLATGSNDDTVRLWNIASPASEMSPVVLGEGFVSDIEICPNGRWLLGHGGKSRLWNLADADPSGSLIILPETAVMSHDGRWLATVEPTGVARLYDLTAKDPTTTSVLLSRQTKCMPPIAFSPNNQWLCVASDDDTVRLARLTAPDLATSVAELAGHDGEIIQAAFSSDARWLVTSGEDGMMRLWDVAVPSAVVSSVKLLGHEEPVDSVRISRDSHWLATRSRDGICQLWDLTAKEPSQSAAILHRDGRKYRGVGLALSPDNRWLVSHGPDNTIVLWELAAPNPATSSIILPGYNSRITEFDISPDGRWLATGHDDGNTWLCDLSATRPADSSMLLSGHEGSIKSIAFSPDNKWIATGAWQDAIVRMWPLDSDKLSVDSGVLQYAVANWAMSTDDRWLVTWGPAQDSIRLWDLTAADPRQKPVIVRCNGLETALGEGGILSPDRKWLVTGESDVRTKKRIVRVFGIATDGLRASSIFLLCDGYNISPDGEWLVAIDGELCKVWNLAPGMLNESPTVLRGNGKLIAVNFSPDGRRMVTSSVNGTAQLWEFTATGPSKPTLFRGHRKRIDTAAISGDGRWLVTASADETIRVWDLSSEDPAAPSSCRVLNGHGARIPWLAITPDSRRLISVGYRSRREPTVRLWDLTVENPGDSSLMLRGHKTNILAMAVSPDGHWLVTSGAGRVTRLWDLTSNDPAASSVVLHVHKEMAGARFSKDSRYLVTGGLSGREPVRIWDMRLEALLERGRRRAGRSLTDEERKIYLLDDPLITRNE